MITFSLTILILWRFLKTEIFLRLKNLPRHMAFEVTLKKYDKFQNI